MTEVATQTESAPSTEGRKRAPAANFLAIVRGRLPVLLVHAIRFNEAVLKLGNKEAAAKFGTSVGKVFDIRKNRNFAYIGADYKPTAEDITAAKEWADQFGSQNAKGLTAQGDKAMILSVVAEYEGKGVATAEEAAKVTEARAATRKPKAKGEKAEKAAPATPPATAEQLLS